MNRVVPAVALLCALATGCGQTSSIVPGSAAATPPSSPAPVGPMLPSAGPVPLTTAGSYLKRPPVRQTTAATTSETCRSHDTDLDQVGCSVVDLAGGKLTWAVGLARPVPDDPSQLRRVIRLWARQPDGQDALLWTGESPPGRWARVQIFTGRLTEQVDGVLVVTTMRESETSAGYDVLQWRKDGQLKLVGHHPEGLRARIFLRDGFVEFFAADYSDGAPPCCPFRYTHNEARLVGGRLMRTELPPVRTPDAAL